MYEPTQPIGLILEPVALIQASIGPNLHTLARSNVRPRQPLPEVLRPVRKLLGLAHLKL